MRNEYTIQQELTELDSKLLLPKSNEAYTVPEGYFEGLATAVLARIKAQEANAAEEIESLSPLLASLSRKMPFEVPGNYFQNAIEGIAAEDTIPAEWEKARFNPTYSVPEGYFETLPEQILAKIQPKKTARVISIGQRWIRYATAACLTGLVAMSSYLYFAKPGVVDVNEHPHQWVTSKLKNTSTQELDAFIQTADATHEIVQAPKTTKAKAEAEVKKLLKDVSDKELEEFLNDVPAAEEDIIEMN